MASSAFISYRRDRGSILARLLKEALERGGLEVFLDVDDLGSGHFDRKLLLEIEGRENFVLVCTPGCLDRCSDEGDFLRLEITHALRTGRNIVPIACEGFSWPSKEAMPADIAELQRHNDIAYSHRHWDSTNGDLLRRMRREPRSFRITIETDATRFDACRERIEQLVARMRETTGLQHPIEVRLLEPRATSANLQEGLLQSLKAADLLLVDVASPAREQMLYRAGLAIGLGIEFATVSSESHAARPPARPDGFPVRSAPSLAADAPRYALQHLVNDLAKRLRAKFE